MAYISKVNILAAYKKLSEMFPDPEAQGATQKVSAIRYFVALDRFYKLHGTPCDTRNRQEKDEFAKLVGLTSDVCLDLYTTNFFYPLKKHDGDYCVGSNFYSAGQVNASLVNQQGVFDYPKRGGKPLFKVQNGKLIRDVNLYKNFHYYIVSADYAVALVVWLIRKISVNAENGNTIYANVRNTLSNVFTSDFISVLLDGYPNSEEILNEYELTFNDNFYSIRDNDIKELFAKSAMLQKLRVIGISKYRPYITAIKSKPFLLLAGISGTGKSRIVRELARACWGEDSEEYKAQKPRNFEMVQVKPNWHDSTELIGYVSRVSGKPEFVAGDFLKFVARAWQETDVPYFLCLDEMNLAPVEQYFAEYLSVIESRKLGEDGNIKTDALLKKESEQWYYDLTAQLTDNDEVRAQFNNEGITLPPNLIVVGTVNMDETTFSFSRKVLDRAMTIEMNEVDLYGGLDTRYEPIGKLDEKELIGTAVEGVDVYADNKEVCDKALTYLQSVNDVLNKEGKPFKVAYRTRNELLLYVVNNLPYDKDKDGNTLQQDYVIARALDEITNMKILPRIEGDDTKVTDKLLDSLKIAIESGLKALTGEEEQVASVSIAKLDEMKERLQSGYTSYWS